jgi:hypothetical protein
LLFDRAGTRSLPASRLRTALGAAVLGSVFGAMTTVVWSETVVWARLFLIAAGVAVVAYPQVATRRHRQREGQHAELRAGYESALVVVGTLVGTRGEPAEVAWLGIALVIASWISCWSAHPNGSVRMREFIERVAPDRLLGTKPAFLGVAYLQLFLSALAQFLAPVWETSTGLTPDLTPGTGGTIPIAASGGDANTPNTGGVPAGAGGEVARGGASGTMATSGATAAGGATGAGGAVNTGGNPTKKDQVKKPRNTGGAMNSATGGVPGTAAGANGGVPSTFAGGGAPSTAAGGVPVTATGGVPGSKPGREAMGGEATSMKAEAVRVACLSKCAEEERRCIASCGATGESSLDDYGVELDVGTTVQSLCEPRCARASQLCAEACESTSIKP